MSVVPIIPSSFWASPFEWSRCPTCHNTPFDHHFGLGIRPSQLSAILENPLRLRNGFQDISKDLREDIIGKDGFQANIDVQQFKPNEVTVKVVDNMVIVEGKHEERQDNESGYISRIFTRKYLLPQGIDATNVVSSISSDGILTIKAPNTQEALEHKERIIPIQQTGPARDSIKVT